MDFSCLIFTMPSKCKQCPLEWPTTWILYHIEINCLKGLPLNHGKKRCNRFSFCAEIVERKVVVQKSFTCAACI